MPSTLQSDERVTFHGSAAWPGHDGAWEAEVRGVVYEPEYNRLYAAVLRRALGIDEGMLSESESAVFRERLGLFLRDHERGKALAVEVAGQSMVLPASGPNGHFRSVIPVPVDAVDTGRGVLRVRTAAAHEEGRYFEGTVHLVADEDAPCVVSDIDDTIKVTGVTDRAELKWNTFCRPFRAVEGMVGRYREWAEEDGARFFYVTSSPWQLYQPLEAFVDAEGFPGGSWHMRHIRLKSPSTLAALFRGNHRHKLEAIRPLFGRWRRRPFLLVGDTGDRDPEIYAELAREFPSRISRVLIRDVGDGRDAEERCAQAFRGVGGVRWELFRGMPPR
jgi:phosphatidate phosphatase APP1